jgi:biotin carboxylase
MNIVYLSPHFPPHYHRFCHHLKQGGANVLGIGDADHDDLAPWVRDSLTEYYHVDDMHNYDALLRACGFFTHKYGKIDLFESLNEYWLETEARIRDDFNIFGVRGRDIDGIRRKSRMKDKFRLAGVDVPRGQLVQSMKDARSLIQETGYPVVAKPDAGVGALGTWRLDSDEDLAKFFTSKPAVDYLMEEFIDGTIYSFDGLADRNGDLVFYTAHTFSQGIMETVNQARHIYYYSLREIPPTLEELGRQCIRAFEVRERFFHIEFFQTAADKYVGLEVNMRPPGGYTTDMFNYACDIDIYQTWAELLVHRRREIPYTRKYHCCYASRKEDHHYLYHHDDIMARYADSIVQVASVPGVFSSALGDIGYIFRAAELDHILEITNFIHATESRQG